MEEIENKSAGRAVGLILGDSEMSRRTRAFAWDKTPLGGVDLWSESLVSTINFVLASPVSTILMVGPELITFYNDAYISTLAERHPDALGMRGDVLWADAWEAVGHQIEAVNATGVAFKFDNVLIPVHRNGVLTDTYFTYSFSPILESRDNSIAGVMCMAQDVTVSHQAVLDKDAVERKLALVAAEHERVMSATTDAIVTVNRNWEFTYLNPAGLAAYALGRDLVGKKLWDEFPDAYFPGSPYVEHYERAMYENTPGSFEAYYPEPLDRWLRLSVFPMEDGIVTFSRDITEEKRRAAVLLQSEKLAAVGRLASSVAHEINNPLEAVTNLLYIARDEEKLSRIRTLLQMADDELRRVAAITSKTLAFHKQSSGPRVVSTDEMFEGALTVFRSRLVNAGIRVAKTVSDCVIRVYEGEIRQVLNNLVSNAVDAMPTGGTLHLRCHRSVHPVTGEAGVTLVVADTGTGIAREKLDKIFEAFYTTKGIGGTGLGLWISREIVQRHGGKLRVRSSQRDEMHGTVFSLFLPHRDPAA